MTCVFQRALLAILPSKTPTEDVYQLVLLTHGATKSLAFAYSTQFCNARPILGLMTILIYVQKYVQVLQAHMVKILPRNA
jgi:hypothetical protein